MKRKNIITKATILSSYFFLPVFFVLANNHNVSGGDNVSLNNYLNVSTIEGLLQGILNIVIVIATPIVILFIIYAGFLYVTAQGDETKLTTAKHALTYALIGGVLILGAVAIGEIIKNLVDAF